ncbi:MAG: glycosyltransferase family 2 protein [bacterium]
MEPLSPLAVLIPTWNGWEDTRVCLETLRAADPAPGRVLVVDNGSEDGTPERIAASFPDVDVLALEENLGFSRAVNRGLAELLGEGGVEAVLLLNNDTEVDPGAPARLLGTLRGDPGAAGVCPLIPYVEPPEEVWYAGGEVALWRGYVGHRGIRRDTGEVEGGVRETGYLTGAAALLRREALEGVGLLSEDFPFYAEDADWSLRARRMGWRLLIDTGAVVRHRVSASVGGPFSRRKLRAKLQAVMLLFRRHARPWHWITLLPGGLLVTLPQVLLGLAGRGRR